MSKKSNKPMQIYNFINDYASKNGYPPSVREICQGVGLSSTSTVHLHLSSLEKQGYIRRDSTRPRAIEILSKNNNKNTDQEKSNNNEKIDNEDLNTTKIPIVGQVTAGEPILAEENILEYFPIPKQLSYGKELFMLQIKGDSMIEAGIYDSDLVIVNKQNTANNGEIIVALLEDEATVKRFYKENEYIRLQPENKAYSPIYSRDVSIIGKVVGLFRNFAEQTL
ncbi:transcriptional repressor LexA [Natranaerobius thermophilus]|uniref:LexA repressor n=1 Tax=Natranaerobius thermophilus (strain ATCC BAA-1301 / DSM 18059 / JW/NM-WN-LF) TaxID=457570 RepID=B2A3Y4_NATTJ|nr:transcriptional repressor LexA [Natranaerobius thermophilus]ACB85086.1 SOS-response transcriptional repressor, LexA [Natranaerobius thermophilus JW/NM-WN-LF]